MVPCSITDVWDYDMDYDRDYSKVITESVQRKGYSVCGLTAGSGTSSTQLPEDEPQSIHIDMLE